MTFGNRTTAWIVSCLLITAAGCSSGSSSGGGGIDLESVNQDLDLDPDGLTTLVDAVQAAGLEETLRSDGPFTVFAPTDETSDASLRKVPLRLPLGALLIGGAAGTALMAKKPEPVVAPPVAEVVEELVPEEQLLIEVRAGDRDAMAELR